MSSKLSSGRASSVTNFARMMAAICGMAVASQGVSAQTWTKVVNNPPTEIELMLLLSDGTVLAGHTYGAGTGYGKTWYKLTPNAAGSYVNGTWTALASSIDTRLWYSSQVLKDGRVFVAGGEYGTGTAKAEVYNPVANTWTAAVIPTTLLNPAQTSPVTGQAQCFFDSNSEILPNGNVLIMPVQPKVANQPLLYNPTTNTWSAASNLLNSSYQDEATWVKLPDGTTLTNDPFGTKSERYNPVTGTWIQDGVLPVQLYDSFGFEQGGGALLPNGKALFLGGTGNVAIYTPTGTTAPGTWAAGAVMPGGRGMPDAPCANLVNGKVLAAMSPAPTSANHFPTPTTFWEYDYTTNTWASVGAPVGASDPISTYQALMLNLPNGQILYSHFSTTVYCYTPAGSPIAAGKPTIQSITPNSATSFHLTGLKINGISEGASYGDDAQMNSNYPIVRINHSNGNVYYARTHDWSYTGVTAGTAVGTSATTEYDLPAGFPAGAYTLVVVANGIASDPATAASIGVQPVASQTVTAGGPVSFSVSANGTPNLTYQWRIGTTNLTNGGGIGGATSSTLTISPTAVGNAATNYNCVVTNALGTVTTNNAELKVRCSAADVTADGVLDLADFFQFLGDFDQTNIAADIDNSGEVDLADFFLFLNLFDTSFC